ncbi:hypothetical protein GX50_04509 [[Emmonsia] crescens]|uniref:GPI anchored protein n=1 Tax=[Emmonsia] crescens TaxID=73230 RepID=A0A2B7ZI28_9EURO|nr:hypothetical protein GX50_04509 [Emmonsia crescens]
MPFLPAPSISHRSLLILFSALQLLTAPIYATTDTPNNNISNANLDRESLVQRDVEIQRRLAGQSPRGVRKMTDNEGEKFWLDYWYFDVDVGGGGNRPDKHKEGLGNVWMNSSIVSLYPASPLHRYTADEDGEDQDRGGGGGTSLRLFGRSLSRWMARDRGLMFGKRMFNCPVDTEPCSSINRPNSCCGKGSKCILVKDTGLGDVGCCGAGDSCSGDLSECAKGYSPCPDNPGGGCCIPGYSCVDQGCIYISTTIVTATPPPPPPAPPSTSNPSPPTITKPITPPSRPTSNPITTITTSPPVTPTITGCPTGFYACSAVYHGGCCRTGRDCNPTSCPTVSSTTIVDDNGATIVIPVNPTALVSSPGGEGGRRCAGGWSSCAASAGGGCCPDGFVCAEVSCTISAEGRGTMVVGKMAPENGAERGVVGCGVGVWAYLILMTMMTMMM